ncbi:hypothetical protein AXFE_06220 [Acidithrix ferrooxidans]|uniref:Uncharacterized protein n=1 Tax=Acidithrix ferrooxidans TaxID=1280514 RepID=A0A0D8HKV5_9ACTN|nr:hypothetical protein AXFE_06220 [Acidithrix ferrooxidans]CAG4907068.1 unnamed protein product [Acidithrix sp. C25]
MDNFLRPDDSRESVKVNGLRDMRFWWAIVLFGGNGLL